MSSSSSQPVQGMSDLASPEIALWQMIESRARAVFRVYGFEEVRTPVLEHTKIFVRSLGDTTEVVQKEMYTFEDRGGRSLTLRPEGTAGVMRYLAGAGELAQSARLFYMGPMFRAERPQAGRKRQFHQIGAESMGESCAAADAECIALQTNLLAEWGLKNCVVQINTRGTRADRPVVAAKLQEALKPHLAGLCEDCRRRCDSNVLRVLDCKQAACREIVRGLPPVTDFMAPESRAYLQEVLDCLKRLSIEVQVNPLLVRGLDYYEHTVWEITHPALGAQDALAGGGRYRIRIGDQDIEGVGFALGVERVIMALEGEGIRPEQFIEPAQVWLVSQGEAAFRENLLLAMTLRRRGISCQLDLTGRSMKAQMRMAGKSGAPQVIIRGDQEMEKGTFLLKDMKQGTQEEKDMPGLMLALSPVHPA